MIIKQNEKVDQIYHCRCRSAVCGWFNDAAGNMIVVLGPDGNGRQPEKFNWQKMFYLNPDEYLRSK